MDIVVHSTRSKCIAGAFYVCIFYCVWRVDASQLRDAALDASAR